MLESVLATGQHQMRSERRECFVLGSPILPRGRRKEISVEESSQSITKKKLMPSAIERQRTQLLDEHRDRHTWRLWVTGPSNSR